MIAKSLMEQAAAGVPVEEYTLTNASGMGSPRSSPTAASSRRSACPTAMASSPNVALGFGQLARLRNSQTPIFGAITGRYANRYLGRRGSRWTAS